MLMESGAIAYEEPCELPAAPVQSEQVVVLQRSPDGFTVEVGDNEQIHISRQDIDRSRCLLTSYDNSCVGDRVPLGLEGHLLKQWREFSAARQADRDSGACLSVPSLLCVLQAADFLDDKATLQQSSFALAKLAFPLKAARAKPAGASDLGGTDHAKKAACARQVVEALPEHLATLTLRAALAAVPPDVRRSTDPDISLTPEHLPTPRRRQAALLALIALLPPHLHRLVFLAHNPAAHDHRTLTLSLPELREAAPVTCAAARCAAGADAHLASLTLVDCSWQRSGAVYGVDVHREHAATRAAVHHVFAPLATLTSLLHLRVELARTSVSAAGGGWVVVCAAALGDVLHQLPQLTSLHMRAWSRCGRAVQELAPHLTVLRALRALDLGRNGLVPLNCIDAPLRMLGAALREMTALTHICLARNWVGANGWFDIEAALTGLPLLSLDLEQCELGDELSLCTPSDGSADPTPQMCPFSGLCRLRLSGNHFSNSSLPFLSHMPHLTELTLSRVMLSAEAYQGLLKRMNAPELALLQLGPCPMEAFAAGPQTGSEAAEAVADALGGCLARCRRLRHVGVPALPASVLAKVLDCLAVLPDLQEVDVSEGRCEGNDSLDAVAAALATCSHVSALRMLEVRGKLEVGSPLWGAIGALTALQRLEFGGDAISKAMIGVGKGCVARGLAPLTQLTRLQLANCLVTPAGAAELHKALQCMSGMRELMLCGVTMGVAAVCEVGRMLPALRMLSVLVLDTKGLCQQGGTPVDAVVGVLPKMRGLRVLRLGSGTYSDECMQEVAQAAPPGIEHIMFT